MRMSDVDPEDVDWLWKPYIPKGKLTLLEGDPAVGKTFLALQLAASISTGAPLPGPDGKPGERRKQATVLYMSAEDGLADTIRPRLDKAGADLNYIFVLTGWKSKNSWGQITLSDVEIIEKALQQVKPALVVVDPLQGYLGAKTDMHRANEVRPILANLAALAEQHRTALLCIRHFNKGQGKSLYRGMGTIDFTAAARSVLVAGQDPDDQDKRAIIQIKNSLAQIGSAIGYKIDTSGNFYWTGLSDLTDQVILQQHPDSEDKSAVKESEEFLLEVLKNGPVEVKEIENERKSAGIAERTLKRAKANLNIKSKKESSSWYWSL